MNALHSRRCLVPEFNLLIKARLRSPLVFKQYTCRDIIFASRFIIGFVGQRSLRLCFKRHRDLALDTYFD